MTGRTKMVVRADGNREIGAGHVMRCFAIAREVISLGYGVLFAVADDASAELVRAAGLDARVVGGNPMLFTDDEATTLVRLTRDVGADCILVDSYGATTSFLAYLHAACSAGGLRLTYIDDMYRCDSGYLGVPQPYRVDMVVNYSFGFTSADYRDAYRNHATTFLVGPRYAPVREIFGNCPFEVRRHCRSVLVTTGSTNPDGILERLASVCLSELSDAEIVVVVGPNALFNIGEVRCGRGRIERLRIERNPDDISALMASSDLAVSAAGTTLYELSSVGVPTIAVPIVENQFTNARGWGVLFPGAATSSAQWNPKELQSAIERLAHDYRARVNFSRQLRQTVDGLGAKRVAWAITQG